MNRLRQEGLYADLFIARVWRPGDRPTFTRQQMLAWFTEGSPTLRYLLSEVDRVHFEAGRKILASEDVPIAAKFYEDALQCVWFHCEVMHSALYARERKELENQSNNGQSSVAVLILMYDVGCVSLNLDKKCADVLALTPAKSPNTQRRGGGRAIRIRQRRQVMIQHEIIKDSHDGFRAARQVNKGLLNWQQRRMSLRSSSNS